MNHSDLIIRSSDRVTGTPSDYSVYVPGNVTDTPWGRMYCQSVYMKGSVFNVTSTNNTFAYSYVGVDQGETPLSPGIFGYPVTVTVTPGHYTVQAIGTAIRNAILDAHAGLGGGMPALDVSIIHNASTNRFQFNVASPTYASGYDATVETTLAAPNTPSDFFVLPNDGSASYPISASDSLNSLLGFVNLTSQYGSYSGQGGSHYYDPFEIVATRAHRLGNLPVLFLECDAIRPDTTFATRDSAGRRILATVTTPLFGSFGVWEASDPPSKTHPLQSTMSSLHIRWTDINNNVVDFQDEDHIIVLRLIR